MKKSKLFIVLAVLCFIISGCGEKNDIQVSDFETDSLETIVTANIQETQKPVQETSQKETEDFIEHSGNSETENSDVHYLGANFNNLQSGGLIAENDDIVVYLTYDDASVFNPESYNNYDYIYSGNVWKYEKSDGSVSIIMGGEGWDSIWSASKYDYPVENINVSKDGTVYLSSYGKASDTTSVYSLNSQTAEYKEITTISKRINTMVLIDDVLYIAAEQGVITYDLKQNTQNIIVQMEDSGSSVKLLSFYGDCLYYSYGSYQSDSYEVMLGSYNVNTHKSETISLSALRNELSDKITWSNVYPSEIGLISVDYDYIAEYNFTDKKVKTYPNPYKDLPKDIPPEPVALVYLDNNYYSYTGNSSSYYTNSFQIIKLKKDFSSAEQFKGVFSIFEAPDGSNFVESNFTFGIADDRLWAASDSIVRMYLTDGSKETIFINQPDDLSGYIIQNSTESNNKESSQTSDKTNEKSTETAKRTGTVTTKEGDLNIRSGASTDSKIIGTAKRNSKIEIIGEKDGWYEIEFDGKTGFVYAEFVKIDAD